MRYPNSKLNLISAITTVFLLFYFVSGFVVAQRFALPEQEEKNSKDFVAYLQNHRIKFTKLLAMRETVDRWKKSLKQQDSNIYSEQQAQLADLASVKSGKMEQQRYKAKWEFSGRQAKGLVEIEKFRSEVAKYNKFRLLYNELATELAKHLQHRQPVDVKELVKKMERLIGELQQAIRMQDYVEANRIAESSTLATEFGYPVKK